MSVSDRSLRDSAAAGNPTAEAAEKAAHNWWAQKTLSGATEKKRANPYRFKSKPGAGYVHIQYIGDVPGKPVEQLRPGDRLLWNGGVTSTVVEVRPKSAKTVVLVERYSDGRIYERAKKVGTLVALAGG